jgi:hypothetical protein
MIKKCTEIGAGRMMPIVSDGTEGEASIASVVTGGGGSWARDDDRYCYGDDDDVYGGGGSGGAMRLDKLMLQLIEASEQCERLDVPRIERFAVSDVQKLSNEFVKTIYSHTEHYFSRRTCISHPPRSADPPSPSPPTDSLANASQCARYQNSLRTTNLQNRGHRRQIRINTGTPNLVWGSPYRNGDTNTKTGIPKPKWGCASQESPYRFGHSNLGTNTHTENYVIILSLLYVPMMPSGGKI